MFELSKITKVKDIQDTNAQIQTCKLPMQQSLMMYLTDLIAYPGPFYI
jgi:hypothetical protein